jgi:hypothetical protein
MSTLSERAILATLNVSQWTARRFDSDETLAVNRKHGLHIEAARVNKNLLPTKNNELQTLQQVTGMIRKDFDKHTLPWSVDGMRILKSEAYMDFAQEVRFWQDAWETARNAFLRAYPDLKREAAAALGSMYDEADYPTDRELRAKFKFDIRFMPIADERDWRIDVGDDVKAKLQADIRAQLIEVEQRAMGEAWGRVQDVLEKTVERLANPTAIFRDSLVDNAVELCAIMPSLNISNDPQMETVRKTIERTLAKFAGNVDALRHDPAEREGAAIQLAEVMRKMAGYMPKRAA